MSAPRKPVQRAFHGLAGRPYEPDNVVPAPAPAPTPPGPVLVPDPPKRKRGRPLTGTVKKTAAEIKRAQRLRQKQELSRAKLSQEQQRIYSRECQRVEAELNVAIAAGDAVKVQEIQDIIRGQEEQREYNAQEARARDRGTTSGLFIADAPRGKGKLIYGGEKTDAVGDKLSTTDEDGEPTFKDSQRRTTFQDQEGNAISSDDVIYEGKETESQFHPKDHPVKWRRDPKRSQFDRRDQEERARGQADEYLKTVAVAVLAWDGTAFSLIRNADEDIVCTLCGHRSRLRRSAEEHLVEAHARKVAPTTTKQSRAAQKLVSMAVDAQQIALERKAEENGWRKVNGKWVRAKQLSGQPKKRHNPLLPQ
jgi:hypothetical protein